MTTRTTTKPKCLLVDADVIICAHEVQVWDKLTGALQVLVASTVVHDEALFYKIGDDPKPDICLAKEAKAGKIEEIAADIRQLDDLCSCFDNVFLGSLHAGEKEALAILKAGTAPEAMFCTGDGRAIEALVLLGLRDKGISFERLLQSVGQQRKLPPHFGAARFKELVARASTRRITGEGLSKEKRDWRW